MFILSLSSLLFLWNNKCDAHGRFVRTVRSTCEGMFMSNINRWILLYLLIILSMVATLLENRY